MSMIVIFSIVVLIVSVVVHEVAHGYAAYRFGDMTAKYQGRLSFNPIKHIDPFGSIILPLLMALLPGGLILGWAKPVPINPYNFKHRRLGEFVTAFAGPLSNMLIASFFVILIRFSSQIGINDAFVSLAIVIVIINAVLALFNLIPIPPLDGYRILSILLPQRYADRFEIFAQRFGIFLVLFFVLVFWHPIFLIIIKLLEAITGVSFS